MNRNTLIAIQIILALGLFGLIVYIIMGITPMEPAVTPTSDTGIGEKVTDWNTFHKASRGIASYPSTNEEIEKVGQLPAPSNSTAGPVAGERKMIGPGLTDLPNSRPTALPIKNHINPGWPDLLAEKLLRYQNAETRVLTNHRQSLLWVEKNQGRNIEEVVITYILPDGQQNSAQAYIDSETGEVIQTWNRTVHEKNIKKGLKLSRPAEPNPS
jgi:hypothetical protein